MKKGLVAIFCVISSLSCYAATHYQCPSSIVCRMNGSNNCIYDTNEYPGMSTITVPMGIDLVCTHNGNLLIGIPQLKGKELTLTSKNFPFSG
ncbi:MAG: hypothetical protein NTU49_09005, partial [Gammaproteobacteria bacterium]|nr:hypothetical protein [Gammaproteobacteria bacterium]